MPLCEPVRPGEENRLLRQLVDWVVTDGCKLVADVPYCMVLNTRMYAFTVDFGVQVHAKDTASVSQLTTEPNHVAEYSNNTTQ